MHGHDRHNTTILSIIHVTYMFRPILFLAIIRVDTIIGENYTMYNMIQYSYQCWSNKKGTSSRLQNRRNMTRTDLHIARSAHTPSIYFVNKISSPSTYTNTDGYTVSYYILCSFLR